MEYKVWKQGSEVVPDTKLVSFSGEEYKFVGCTHPRKINVVDKDGMHRQFFPSVFGVLIKESEE